MNDAAPAIRPEERPQAISGLLRWGAAAAVVLLVHVSGAFALMSRAPAASERPGVREAVLVELAPLPAAPETSTQDIAPAPPVEETLPDPMAEASPPEAPAPDPLVDIPVPQQAEIKLPDLPAVKEAAAVLPPSRPPEPAVQPKPRVKKPEVVKKPTMAPAPARASAAPPSQARISDSTAPQSSGSTSSTGSVESWRGKLAAHLNRHKRFPPGATGEGSAMVVFSVSRSGQILSARLVNSSGDRALDQEALALLSRASPVPAPPDDLGGSTLSLSVPIRFNR